MGNIDIIAALKYLWAILFPIFLKAWSIVDRRLNKTEEQIQTLITDHNSLSAKIDVLTERSVHTAESVERLDEKFDDLQRILMQILQNERNIL